jgi:hypothetical protein
MTSSVLRLPAFVRDPWLAALRDPVVLFVHPWEFVDLTRERLRYDCRFRRATSRCAACARSSRPSHARRLVPADARARRVIHPPASIRRSGRLLALLALAGLIVVAMQRMDLGRAAAQLAVVRGQWLALAIACYALILPLWAWQWALLSPRTPTSRPRDMLGVVALTSSVLNTTPMLVGEATAVVLLVTRAGLDRPAALSVLAMDQLLVGVAKLCVLALAAIVAPLPDWMTRAVLGLLASLLLLGAALVVAAWRHADVEEPWRTSSHGAWPPDSARSPGRWIRSGPRLEVSRRWGSRCSRRQPKWPRSCACTARSDFPAPLRRRSSCSPC